MANSKPTSQEKRENARREILNAALELFYTKGFNETTTNDIASKVGILNGSLYNRFKSKDDILISLMKEAMVKILDDCEEILRTERNLVLASSFPGAIQLFVASRSPRLAQLLYIAHCKWSAVEEYSSINLEWAHKFLKDYGYAELGEDILRMKVVSSLGSVGNMIGLYVSGTPVPCRTAVREHVLLTASSLGLPCPDADAVLDKLQSIIRSLDLVFLGHNIRAELPGFSE